MNIQIAPPSGTNQIVPKSAKQYTAKDRPRLSVIIPCYNSGDTIGNLLQSILDQGLQFYEVEVILSDDHSTEPYDDVVNEYTDKLNIRRITTDYNYAPGNTREKGLSIAEGEWITFADHDDVFLPNAFKTVFRAIDDNDEQYMVQTDFYEFNIETGKKVNEMINTTNWMHGKFYNLDNFFKEFNIHFTKDLLTHEDICVSCKVGCALHRLGRLPLYLNTFTYQWNSRPSTVSRRKYDNNYGFLEQFLDDYIKSTADVYDSAYENGEVDYEFAMFNSVSSLLYGYFYIQGFKKDSPTGFKKENLDVCRRLLVREKELYSITNEDIFKLYQNRTDMYFAIRDQAYVGVGPFVETDSLMQFLDYLHKDIKPRRTMIEHVLQK